MNKIVHISVRDNRKSDFTEKPKAFAFFNIFIGLGPYLLARIFKLGLKNICRPNSELLPENFGIWLRMPNYRRIFSVQYGRNFINEFRRPLARSRGPKIMVLTSGYVYVIWHN